MYEDTHTLILPGIRAEIPRPPSEEIVCITGGRAPKDDWLRALIAQREKNGARCPVWAIDRGVNITHALGILPNRLIGDGDSASIFPKMFAKLQGVQIDSFPREKDFTDTELALQIAAKEIERPLVILTAAFGGRLDHLMSTAAVAAHAAIPCVLADERETLFYLRAGEELTVTCESAPRAISLLPFTAECSGVKTRRLYWELDNEDISAHSSRAISNELAPEYRGEKKFTVSIKTGILGVYLCHKE